MAAASQRSESYKAQREVEDLHLVLKARSGNRASEAEIIRRYAGFVRLRSSSYFIAGGDPTTSCRRASSASTRPSATTGSTRTRRSARSPSCASRARSSRPSRRPPGYKHAPLNGYVSFSHTPAGHDDGSRLHARRRAARARRSTILRAACRDARSCRRSSAASAPSLSPLEARVLTLYLEGRSYEEIGEHRRVRPEGRRQRPAARQAQGRPAPGHARRARRLI